MQTMSRTHGNALFSVARVGDAAKPHELDVLAFYFDPAIAGITGRTDHHNASRDEPIDGLAQGSVSARVVRHVMRKTQRYQHNGYSDSTRPDVERPYDVHRDQRVELASNALVIEDLENEQLALGGDTAHDGLEVVPFDASVALSCVPGDDPCQVSGEVS